MKRRFMREEKKMNYCDSSALRLQHTTLRERGREKEREREREKKKREIKDWRVVQDWECEEKKRRKKGK